MKKVLAINGSPRKNWNTAMMLEKALEGAAEAGAETKLVHLRDLKFTGCASCFACKLIEKNAQLCALKDDLRPLLEECMAADALIVGSPIYFGNLSGLAVNFLERLLFMNYTYDLEAPTKFSGKIASALVCTMNVDEETMKAWGYVPIFERYTQSLGLLLGGPSEWLSANDTLQYPDYGKYMSRAVDPAHKLKMREEKFPKDQEAARQLGARLAAA